MTRKKKASDRLPEPAHQPWEIPLGGGEYGINLDVYFELLEREVGFSLIAYDAEADDVVYGGELVEMISAQVDEGVTPTATEPDPEFSVEQERKLKAAEEELGYRLIGYHRGSETVMFGGELLDEMNAKFGIE